MPETISKSTILAIDWEAVDALSRVDIPDEDSPELDDGQFAQAATFK